MMSRKRQTLKSIVALQLTHGIHHGQHVIKSQIRPYIVLTVSLTKADHCSGIPSTCVRNGCRSSVAALGLSLGVFTRQHATKSLNSSENEPSSTGGGF